MLNTQSILNTQSSIPVWAGPIASELDMVERTLASTVFSDVSPAFDLSMHLLTAGGKRIRPALVMLSALASAQIVNSKLEIENVVGLAAASELIHMASLVHDDVLDETRERRGARTANDSWGNKISVLGGDYLLSKAFQLLAGSGPDVLRVLSGTAIKMTESEMLQASSEGDLDLWEANYWRIIHGKTAEFTGACCECGAYLSGADLETRSSLREYGIQLGLAFQITDDVLDISGDPATTGKPTGADLANGKFTLPVLLALSDAKASASLRKLLGQGGLTQSEAEHASAIVIESGVVEEARGIALDYAAKAREQLQALPQSDYTRALESLAAFVIDREA